MFSKENNLLEINIFDSQKQIVKQFVACRLIDPFLQNRFSYDASFSVVEDLESRAVWKAIFAARFARWRYQIRCCFDSLKLLTGRLHRTLMKSKHRFSYSIKVIWSQPLTPVLATARQNDFQAPRGFESPKMKIVRFRLTKNYRLDTHCKFVSDSFIFSRSSAAVTSSPHHAQEFPLNRRSFFITSGVV